MRRMTWTPTRRIALIALLVVAGDQLTKFAVLRWLGYAQERTIVPGFFKFVHWGNTGAAWSLFQDSNAILAVVSLLALVALFFYRHRFDTGSIVGQASLGMIFGGILGNLTDRVIHHHVIDFLYFHLHRRGGQEIGFPAFNVADSGICVGVALLFLISWRSEAADAAAGSGRDQAHRTEPLQR